VLLLICALGLAVGPVGHALAAHKHLPRAVAVAAASTLDEHPGVHRSDLDAVVAAPPAPVRVARAGADPADPSSIPSSVTVHLQPVRGPPAQAAG
jgi:hypothetical protein